MGPEAQIGEGRRVPVGGDLAGGDLADGGVHLVVTGTHRLDDLSFEGLVHKEGEPLVDGVLVTDERLVLGHDLAHSGLDAAQVVVAEVGPTRELEVVVEAVLDDRADGVVGTRPQAEHRLGQHMGGGVAEHRPAGIGIGGDHLHFGAVGDRGSEVDLGAVERSGHGRLGQAGADRLCDLHGGGALVELLGGSIRKSNNDGCHGIAFLQLVGGRRAMDRSETGWRPIRPPASGLTELQGNAQQRRPPDYRTSRPGLVVERAERARGVQIVVEALADQGETPILVHLAGGVGLGGRP